MVHINIFKDNDNWNDDYYLVTTEDVSMLLNDIEYCFVIEDADETLQNLIENKADKRIIDFIHDNYIDYDSVYEFTYNCLAYHNLLLNHKKYEYVY